MGTISRTMTRKLFDLDEDKIDARIDFEFDRGHLGQGSTGLAAAHW